MEGFVGNFVAAEDTFGIPAAGILGLLGIATAGILTPF